MELSCVNPGRPDTDSFPSRAAYRATDGSGITLMGPAGEPAPAVVRAVRIAHGFAAHGPSAPLVLATMRHLRTVGCGENRGWTSNVMLSLYAYDDGHKVQPVIVNTSGFGARFFLVDQLDAMEDFALLVDLPERTLWSVLHALVDTADALHRAGRKIGTTEVATAFLEGRLSRRKARAGMQCLTHGVVDDTHYAVVVKDRPLVPDRVANGMATYTIEIGSDGVIGTHPEVPATDPLSAQMVDSVTRMMAAREGRVARKAADAEAASAAV